MARDGTWDANLVGVTPITSRQSGRTQGWLLSALTPMSQPPAVLLSVSFLAVIVLADWATGPERSLGVFYVIPIALVTLRLNVFAGAATSVLSVLAWVIADFDWSTTPFPENLPYWNAVVRLGFFVVVTALLAALKRENEPSSPWRVQIRSPES